jgi:hypothetical protein
LGIRKLLTGILLFSAITACSNTMVGERGESVSGRFWEGEPAFFYKGDEKVNAFVEAVNRAETLKPQKVIQTAPLLTFTLSYKKDEQDIDYSLWLTKDGKGYIQSLIPRNSITSELDKSSAAELTEIMEKVRGVELSDGVDFED